jgi:hypothetical protein
MNRQGNFPPGGDGVGAKLGVVFGCGQVFAVKKPGPAPADRGGSGNLHGQDKWNFCLRSA